MSDYKLVIFDFNGTLVSTKSGETFQQSADDWQFMQGRVEKCKALVSDGVTLAIASNQAGVAFPWSRFTEEEMKRELERAGAQIGTSFIALCCSTPNVKALPQYHNPNDIRRKPGPGMLLEAIEAAGVSAEHTLMVGDRDEDRDAAHAANVNFMWAKDYFGDEE